MKMIENLKLKIGNSVRSGTGFTLLEMTIAMVILSLLAGVGFLSYLSVLESNRDSTRQSDLKRVQNALEMYYSDNHAYIDEGSCSSDNWVDLNDLGSELNGYIDELPSDPSAPDYEYSYCSFDNDLCYCLAAELEKDGDSYEQGACNAPSGSGTFYVLTCP